MRSPQGYEEWFFVAAPVVASVVCIVHLWLFRREDRILRRILWTPVVAIPLLGPMFYGALYTRLDSHDEDHENEWTKLGDGDD